MLYYLHKKNYIDECVIEHPDFSTFQLDDFMDIDENIITKIKSDLPYVFAIMKKISKLMIIQTKLFHTTFTKTIFT